MNNETIDAILDFIVDFLLALQNGEGWRWFKRNFRKHIWKPHIKPLLNDLSWVPDALAYVAILKVILGQLMASESLRQKAMNDPASILRKD